MSGSFHLLHLMFDDYVLYLVESLQSHERYNELLAAARGTAQRQQPVGNNNNNNNNNSESRPLTCQSLSLSVTFAATRRNSLVT